MSCRHLGSCLCSFTAVPTRACREGLAASVSYCPDVVLQQVTARDPAFRLNLVLSCSIDKSWESYWNSVLLLDTQNKMLFGIHNFNILRHHFFFLRHGFTNILSLILYLNFFQIKGFKLCLFCFLAFLVAQRIKRLPAMQETWVQSLGQEDPLEKEMATHSSILAWRIPWTEEPGELQSTGSQRVGHNWVTSLQFHFCFL